MSAPEWKEETERLTVTGSCARSNKKLAIERKKKKVSRISFGERLGQSGMLKKAQYAK